MQRRVGTVVNKRVKKNRTEGCDKMQIARGRQRQKEKEIAKKKP